ncbi:MAG: HU family DNA-binding protein [Abitibacteriaceae bacterium]|nr:HU family DNA-binding protein [Abditibacteriaceae bacterium]MBV9868349.1 HU family DNA-binding protein [Abditibacteriaceae bacterium]
MAASGNKGSKAAPLSRGDIVSEVAALADLPQSKADQVVRAYEDAIIRALSSGGEVRIAGFGTFRTSARAARTARNPQTGAPLKIAARTVARFTPSSAFKEAVGGGKGGSKGGAKGGAQSAAKGGSKGGAKGSSGGAKGGAKGGSKK